MLAERSALRDNPGDDHDTCHLAMHRSFASHQRNDDLHGARERPHQVQPFPEQAPLVVENFFVGHSLGGYSEGTISYHAIPKSMIQTRGTPPEVKFEDKFGDDSGHDST